MPLRRFDGKVALVTGAASGIGRATALRLASEGGRIVLADNNLDGAEAVADLIAGRFHPGARAIAYDAADPDACRRMVDHALDAHGRLDVLINNAGIYRRGHFAQTPAEEWALVMKVNLDSVFHITQQALPALLETGGNVVSTASTAALNGIAYASPYAAAKAGVIALTKSLATEYAPHGVRLNAVCPGRVLTNVSVGVSAVPDADPSLIVRGPKLGTKLAGADPEDLAGAYAYLASDDAAFVTGSILVADGGLTVG
ncbi:SDR family NAD(P)-dependent oxidoreductase [Microvirga sp. M2]|uniref:SDR family NAD(P)-dependent oxidoreductase n=1 Tax=Microvirga sp. M2 TaxID=3073270 RepID=UPI0039C199A6